MPTAREIAEYLGREDELVVCAEGMNDVFVSVPKPIDAAGPDALSFLGSTAKDPEALLSTARAGLLIIDRELSRGLSGTQSCGVLSFLVSANARLEFIRVLQQFFAASKPSGVHKNAVVEDDTDIHETAYVGPHCTVARDVTVGEGTVLHSGVHVYEGTRIGRNVTIHSGAVIGADGFGYERNEEGVFESFPHLGNVVIEDDVEIGANAAVDRGTLGATVLRKGVKIGNLVHIAHNVEVGAHVLVIAQAYVGGGTRIGAHAWVAPAAALRDRVLVGEGATVGIGALVVKDVPPNSTYVGSPARDMAAHKKLLAHWSDVLSR